MKFAIKNVREWPPLTPMGILLGISKCIFAASETVFCGHSVSPRGIQISPKRVTLLKEYPKFDCRSKKKNADLTLLGFYNYHHKWVKNYSKDRDT